MAKRLRILIAEDDSNDFHLAKIVLQKAGIDFDAHQTKDRTEFLNTINSSYDIVIADYVLDGLSGTEVVKYMKDKYPEIPIIMMSGRMGEQLVIDTMKAGAFDYVMKDKLSLLSAAVDRAVQFLESQRSLKEAQLQLLEKNRLEALGLVAATVAHDLNNFLISINLGLEAAKSKFSNVSGLDYYLNNFDQCLKLATNLSRQFLNLSKNQEDKAVPVKVIDVMNQVRPNLEKFLLGKGTLVLNSDPSTVVHLAPGQLEQILFNLVINASHALYKENSKIEVNCSTQGTETILTVKDDGKGIPANEQLLIFNPFFSTKAAQGSGLGLASVQRIVESSKGKIGLESHEGVGTKITISWSQKGLKVAPPTGTQRIQEETKTMLAAASQNGQPTKLYILEDEVFLREILNEFLSQLNFQVIEVGNKFENFLSQVKVEDNDSFIIDCNLSGVNGLSVAQSVRKANPKAKIVVISGLFTSEQEQLMQTSRLSFLQKPFDLNQLVATIRSRHLDL